VGLEGWKGDVGGAVGSFHDWRSVSGLRLWGWIIVYGQDGEFRGLWSLYLRDASLAALSAYWNQSQCHCPRASSDLMFSGDSDIHMHGEFAT